MSILSGDEIKRHRALGNIKIEPFDEVCLGPNSYDVHLGDRLCTYGFEGRTRKPNEWNVKSFLDPRVETLLESVSIVDGVWWLHPGRLYIGHTKEVVGCPIRGDDEAKPLDCQVFVPLLEGKSGVGRLGISIHATAGFGDAGFVGDWTLEISVVEPTILIPGMLIGQFYFQLRIGGGTSYDSYKHSYQGQLGPTPSRLWRTFK